MGRQRAENLYRDLSTERRREEQIKSRDLSNRSLKTDQETEIREPTYGFLERKRGEETKVEEQRSEKHVPEDRWGDGQQRTYLGIDISMTSLKKDGETESRDPT